MYIFGPPVFGIIKIYLHGIVLADNLGVQIRYLMPLLRIAKKFLTVC